MILSPGPHTLQLVLADKNHIPHSPPVMSERIHIVVEQPPTQSSPAPAGQSVAHIPGPESKRVEVPPGASDSNTISQRAYELAERVGTRAAWEFLAAHSTGLYAEHARRQLDKLNAVRAAEKEAMERAERELADRLVRQRQEQARAEVERRQAEKAAALEAERLALERQRQEREDAEAKRHETQRAAALRAERLAFQRQEEVRRREIESEPRREAALRLAETPDPRQRPQACRQDAERLERLRATPAPEEVARFAQEIVCEELRPQVLHLLDSLMPAVPAAPQGTEHRGTEREAAVPQANAEPDPKRRDLACKRDEERLVRLRASRARDDVVRFAGDLACERLRPQVQRLLESIGG